MPRPSDPRPESGFRISGIGLRISPSPLSNYHPASGERVGLGPPELSHGTLSNRNWGPGSAPLRTHAVEPAGQGRCRRLHKTIDTRLAADFRGLTDFLPSSTQAAARFDEVIQIGVA